MFSIQRSFDFMLSCSGAAMSSLPGTCLMEGILHFDQGFCRCFIRKRCLSPLFLSFFATFDWHADRYRLARAVVAPFDYFVSMYCLKDLWTVIALCRRHISMHFWQISRAWGRPCFDMLLFPLKSSLGASFSFFTCTSLSDHVFYKHISFSSQLWVANFSLKTLQAHFPLMTAATCIFRFENTSSTAIFVVTAICISLLQTRLE